MRPPLRARWSSPRRAPAAVALTFIALLAIGWPVSTRGAAAPASGGTWTAAHAMPDVARAWCAIPREGPNVTGLCNSTATHDPDSYAPPIGPLEPAVVALMNHKILVAGGFVGSSGSPGAYRPLLSSWLYDPRQDAWAQVGPMHHVDEQFGATNKAVLLSDGRVLYVHPQGSTSGCNCPEYFDPVTNTWTDTKLTPSQGVPFPDTRQGFTLTPLSGSTAECGLNCGGALLVGTGNIQYTLSLLYNAGDKSWRYTSAPAIPRRDPLAALIRRDAGPCGLSCGRVMLAGGFTDVGAGVLATELFNPASETWEPGGVMPGAAAPVEAQATVLRGGQVLVAGGAACETAPPPQYVLQASPKCSASRVAHLYAPASRTWSTASDMLHDDYDGTTVSYGSIPVFSQMGAHHSATLLPSGKVLVSGQPGRQAELFDPDAGAWADASPMMDDHRPLPLPPNYLPSAVLLSGDGSVCGQSCGRVLSVGGLDAGGHGGGAELYSPPAPVVSSVSPSTGPADGGTRVTIRGSGLASPESVAFGDPSLPADVVMCGLGAACYSDPDNPDTVLHVVAPPHDPGAVDVTVMTSAVDRSALSPGDEYTYVRVGGNGPDLTLSALSQDCGSTTGGAAVVISGSTFPVNSATTVVLFGSSSAPAVVSSVSQLTTHTPAHVATTVPVRVSVDGGHRMSRNALAFTYSDSCTSFDDKLTSARRTLATGSSAAQSGPGGQNHSLVAAPPGGTGAGPGAATATAPPPGGNPGGAAAPGALPIGGGVPNPSLVGLPDRQTEPAAPQEGYSMVGRHGPVMMPEIGLGALGAGLMAGCFSMVLLRRSAATARRAAARRAYA